MKPGLAQQGLTGKLMKGLLVELNPPTPTKFLDQQQTQNKTILLPRLSVAGFFGTGPY